MKLEECKVLLIEDNPGDAHLVKKFLSEASAQLGFSSVTTTHYLRLTEGLESVGREEYSVILLDLSLPDSQGLDAVSRLSIAAARTPIVVLTGLEDQEASLQALQEGAQDYFLKSEIDAKSLIRSIRYSIERKRTEINRLEDSLRRQVTAAHLSKVRSGTLELNLLNQTLAVSEGEHPQTISLPPREFKLLLYLFKNEARVVSRDEILAHVWSEDDSKPNPRCIDTLVSSLKKKSKAVESRIESVYGAGYRITKPTP